MSHDLARRCCLLVASLALTWTGDAHAHSVHCSTIADARSAPTGTSVTLIGTVSVPSGAFDGGFAIQQGRSGIYVVDSDGGNYQIGDLVRVRGVLIDSNNLLAVQPTAIFALGHAAPVRAVSRATGDVGESTEGRLLHLTGAIKGDPVDDSPYGYKLTLDDGSGPIQLFLYPGAGIVNDGLVDGASLSVTCFSNQYDTHYECDPRTPADLTIGAP
jgi:hypothetical protein